ncbi:OLC1v1007073C1 [Oldenlandia corymbosa var. corymbosa]|uniref:OLC1v1007073C1 n=1 Tax=Oldenlandia corymbosa var. corymbosa TaxID=529605 RepID=A0AAV1DIG6_OLDCO|nr:OLC1v1007073C1 [Oldenlandia corymbosa var. corymbosa]
MEMQMKQFRTPQYPSTQKAHYWDIHEPQQFSTPQHPTMAANKWDGTQSLRFDYGTANHWVGADSLRYDYATPQPEFLGGHEYWEDDLPSEGGSPRSTAARNYWGNVDGRRHFGTPLSPAAFRTKKTPERDLIPKSIRTPEHPAANGKNVWGTPDRIRQFGTPQHPSAFKEFRTPQHPSQGTNNWGGASPLLARNIPQESLDKRYERLNTIRTQDAIFSSVEEDDNYHNSSSGTEARYRGHEIINPNPDPIPTSNATKRPRGLLWKWMKKKEQDPKVQGNPSKKKKKWFRRFDVRKRWPTGWY